jgi:hypothetical protein
MRSPLFWMMILLLASSPAHADAPECQAKAAVISNFALFVEWPPTAFPNSGSPFVVGILGEDPFGSCLKQQLGDRVGTHPVEIRHLQQPDAAAGCHIVFVSRSEEQRLAQTVSALRNTGALIISDVADGMEFCRQGGMIALEMEGGKVRFDLNSDALAGAGLKIDSRLKRIAHSTRCGQGQ